MENLVVRNLDQRIVDALKQRAAQHGRSAEAEHRALLDALLLRPKGKSFAEALTGMPNVGQDEDFERVEDKVETTMYLVDTHVISEVRKKSKANKGVRAFFKQTIEDETPMFISVVTVGELRRGVELIRYRGDVRQANQLEKWLQTLTNRIPGPHPRYQPGYSTALGTATGAASRKRFGQASGRNGADL